MTTLWAALVPAIAVIALVETVRTTPTVRANLRVRRRLADVVPIPRSMVTTAATTPRADRTIPTTASRTLRQVPAVLRTPVERVIVNRRRRAVDRDVPERLDRIIRRLRAGSNLSDAIVGVGVGDDVLASLAADIAIGRRLAPAVARWRAEDPSPNRRLAAVALELSAEAGGSSASVLDGVAESLRDRVALEREVVALSSQARASAALLVIAPVAFTLVVGAVEPRLWSMLVGSPIGWVCLGLGLGLDALGAVWMARLVGRHR